MNRYLLSVLLALPFTAIAKNNHKADSAWLVSHYNKKEVYIPMRDGARLYTAIYQPKNIAGKHPILMNRTPYSIAPYGENKFKEFWKTHYMAYFKKGYIVVLQDVRGRMMSEGTFMDVRPFNIDKQGNEIDEASDTYDAIDWLVKNTKNNNGRVGIFGISYPGFYATMGALSNHPAMVASSPQAPVTEWFLGDDFHHNGAFMEMDAFGFYSIFGKPRPKPTTNFGKGYNFPVADNYKFYLEAGPLKNLAKMMGDSIAFWQELYKHPNYDQWWQERNTRNHVQHIPKTTATLVTGGLFDAEDCYGAWELYKAIEKRSPNDNRLVMGPWVHGGWAKGAGEYLGNVRFGSKTSEWYQKKIEIPFFEYHLEGKGTLSSIPEASVFFTGENEWHSFNQWPPANAAHKKLYFDYDGLTWSRPEEPQKRSYTSDPQHPVPYADGVHMRRTTEYMVDDQRFAARRADVVTFTTPVLNRDLTIGGQILANIYASISTTDADFVVKLIDVFPDDFSWDDKKDGKGNGKDYTMGGYQMLVRGEIMRGRYRNSFQYPEAFQPGKISKVSFALPDAAHVFKKGHRIMVQVQSSWFPLADRNPQQFVNIYTCNASDFVKSKITIHTGGKYASNIELPVME
jgi:hypothetical protein